MLSVYDTKRELARVPLSSLPTEYPAARQTVLKATSRHYNFVEFFDVTGQPMRTENLQQALISMAIVANSYAEIAACPPIKVTVRRTDKTGHVIYRHPSDTVDHLKKCIEELTGIPAHFQYLIHGGHRLEYPNSTVDSLNFRQTSMVHVIDLSKKLENLEEPFIINAQTAQSFSQTYEIEVCGGYSVQQLKEIVSYVFEIAPESTLITYCGRILPSEQATLFECNMLPGCFINVINEKRVLKAPTEKNEQVLEKENIRTQQVTQVLNTKEQSKVEQCPPKVEEMKVENNNNGYGKENSKRVVTMSLSISSDSKVETTNRV